MPTLIFNTSTGNDATASGSQGSISANGTSASYSGSVVTLDGSPDLSGFDAAEDVLWLQTSTGRQFFDLSSADDGADTVTCVNAPAGTASGLTWGIGGKRNDFDNSDTRNIFADLKQSWIIETETSQTISSSIILSATVAESTNAHPMIRGSSGSRKTISINTDNQIFRFTGTVTDCFSFDRLKLQCTAGTHANANGIQWETNNTGSNYRVSDCEIGDTTNRLQNGLYSSSSTHRWGELVVADSYIHDCDGSGIFASGSVQSGMSLINCVIYNNDEYGARAASTSAYSVFYNNIIAKNGSAVGTWRGLEIDAAAQCFVMNNTFYDNDTGNLYWGGGSGQLVHTNNIYHTADYNIGGTSPTWSAVNIAMHQNNLYYNATSGDVEDTGLGVGANAITAQDPLFTDPANGDYSLQAASPAKAAGYPGDISAAGLSTGYTDIGAVQRQEPAGSGGLILINRSNSLITR